jgi:DNA repair exonuclease SbcCD ATPase subunit
LSSSKTDAKQEARFAARIDVLSERVDTLAATVATTASAMAKKDGEIASLRRDLQARDEAIQALAASQGGRAAASIDPRVIQELQQTVAALAGEHGKQGSSKQLDDLAAKIGLLGQRLETLSTTVSTTAAGLAGREGELATIRKRLDSPDTAQHAQADVSPTLMRQLEDFASSADETRTRLEAQATELAALRVELERRAAEPQPPSDELRTMLATLRSRVEALAGLHAGVSEERLDERLAENDDTVTRLSERVEALAEGVELATASLAGKEHELAALHRLFSESSGRIESVVDDIREALSVLPDTGPAAMEELAARIEQTSANLTSLTARMERREAASRDASEVRERSAAELTARLEALDQRVAGLATELARAKTLWPVALRSLEARLDDAVPRAHQGEQTTPDSPEAAPEHADDDDLLADLRESLHAMESVAEELERASETRPVAELPPEPVQEAVAGGARVVPLRANDP